MIYCKIAKVQCKCTWAEHSSSADADCGEIMGGLMTQSILNAAASVYHDAIPPAVIVDFDNNGFFSHGNAPLCSLPANQTQADVLRTFKHLVSAQPFCAIFKYVQLHADEKRNGVIAH
jgi:hypothetical protein